MTIGPDVGSSTVQRKSMRSWVSFGKSVRGRSHLKSGLPNQDAFRIEVDHVYGVYAAVVSDGAGSASRSQIGSTSCVDFLAKEFLQIGLEVATGRIDSSFINEKIYEAIFRHQKMLGCLEGKLADYHHTLTAVIFSGKGGRLIRVGDSPAVVLIDSSDHFPLDLDSALRSSKVYLEKKGEYANETTFATQAGRESIFITSLPRDFSAIFLMTDGAASAFISKGAVYPKSVKKLLSDILVNSHAAASVVESYLTHPELDNITADDKTFVGFIPKTWFEADRVNLVDYGGQLARGQENVKALANDEHEQKEVEVEVEAYQADSLLISKSPKHLEKGKESSPNKSNDLLYHFVIILIIVSFVSGILLSEFVGLRFSSLGSLINNTKTKESSDHVPQTTTVAAEIPIGIRAPAASGTASRDSPVDTSLDAKSTVPAVSATPIDASAASDSTSDGQTDARNKQKNTPTSAIDAKVKERTSRPTNNRQSMDSNGALTKKGNQQPSAAGSSHSQPTENESSKANIPTPTRSDLQTNHEPTVVTPEEGLANKREDVSSSKSPVAEVSPNTEQVKQDGNGKSIPRHRR